MDKRYINSIIIMIIIINIPFDRRLKEVYMISYSLLDGEWSPRGHFRITFDLFFEANPGAYVFICKLVFICM